MTEELWKPVDISNRKLPGGQPKYWVSNMGRVRIPAYQDASGQNHAEKYLKQRRDKIGFWRVCIQTDKVKYHQFYVHRLVAMAFVDNPYELLKVGHKDGNMDNNYADNLQWGLSWAAGCRGKPKKSCTVRQYTLDGEFVAEHGTCAAAAKKVYIQSPSQISEVCNRVPMHNTCAGFLWRWADDDEFAGETC